MTTPLSCYLLTKNSERRLEQVLRSVRDIADEIIVVDSGSGDRTLEIAASFGARVIFRAFDNFRDQRVFAEDQCSHVWTLALDSDEVVSPALADRIRQFKATDFDATARTPPDGFDIRRDWFFLGRPVRVFYPVRTPEYVVRLFRRDRINHRGSRIIHESVQRGSGNPIGVVEEPLLHYCCDSIDNLYDKIGLYTTLAAQDMHASGVRATWIKRALYPWLIWLRWYILYGGWRDGVPGRILGKYVRDTVYLKYLKLRYDCR